ncbi:MAG: FRG domain-containing protein [Phycisphaerae bacterium]|nr:FRG domain-containing protein [Phycisphaerae bacterium]
MADEMDCRKEGGIIIYPKDKKKAYSWDDFSNLFNDKFTTNKDKQSSNKLYLGNYIWRGHRCADWKLLSSLDREFKEDNGDFVCRSDRETVIQRHLNSFAYAVRSRLKEFRLTVVDLKDLAKQNKNHIWALGRHYGLKAPILDWCYSPYVANYFAFKGKNNNHSNMANGETKYRVIWGLNYKQVCDNYKETGIFNTGIEYFAPMSLEHPRLIEQRGLFTITKNGKAIEDIVKDHSCVNCNEPWLIKIELTDSKENREEFLRRLSTMDINDMSLFPEIEGAAEFCNIGLEFDEYARFHGQGWG